MAIADEIRSALRAALEKFGVSSDNVTFEHPADLAHGDYATGVALAKAKEAGSTPRAFAEKLVASLNDGHSVSVIRGVKKIEVAGPGFINFTLAPEMFAEAIEEARTSDMWGSNDSLKDAGQMLIEYTSPNLFKPLHVGNLVGNTIGEIG